MRMDADEKKRARDSLSRGRTPECKEEARNQAGGIFVLIRLQNWDVLFFEKEVIYHAVR